MVAGGDGELVGADLVGGVAIGADAVGADDHPLHLRRSSSGGRRRSRRSGSPSMPSCSSSQTVRRAPCSQGRVSPANTWSMRSCGDAGADHAQRGAETGGGQRAGVAVGQHAAAGRDQLGAQRDPCGGWRRGPRFRWPGLRFRARVRQSLPARAKHATHARERPHQVDRGRSRGIECVHRRRPWPHPRPRAVGGVDVARGQHHAPGGRDADRRRAAHDQVVDRLGRPRGCRCRSRYSTDERQLALVEQFESRSSCQRIGRMRS